MRLLQKELDTMSGETINHLEANVDPKAEQDLRRRVVAQLYSTKRSRRRQSGLDQVSQPKSIILTCMVQPFAPQTRANDLEENGLPWRCDGNPVTFTVQQFNDELQVFTTDGEFVTSFPVGANGQVAVTGLPPDVYILYLRGRRIAEMNFA